MKKLALFFTAFLFVFSLKAQKMVYDDIEFGLKGGINVSGLHGSLRDSIGSNYKVGFNFGVFTKYYISDKFKVGIEVQFTRKGYKADIFDTVIFAPLIYVHNLYQVEFPLFLEYDITPISSFELGGAYGLTVFNEKVNFPGISPFNENSSDISGFVGYNYYIDEYTSLGFRYSYGLNPIIETSTKEGFSSNFQVFFRSRLL